MVAAPTLGPALMDSSFTFIVPFHRDLTSLERCLAALCPLPPDSELIIAADGATEDCRPIAAGHGAMVVDLPGPSGPSAARNAAAAVASGDVLVFVDADVEVSRAGLERVRSVLVEQPEVAAVFGSYDDRPGDPGFMSRYQEPLPLLHSPLVVGRGAHVLDGVRRGAASGIREGRRLR